MMTQTELMKDLFGRFSVCGLRPAGVDKRWTWGATCTRKHVWRLWRRQKSDELHSQSSPGEKALRKKGQVTSSGIALRKAAWPRQK